MGAAVIDQLVIRVARGHLLGLCSSESSCRKKREVDLFHVIGVKVFVQGWKVNDGFIFPDGKMSHPLNCSGDPIRGTQGRGERVKG